MYVPNQKNNILNIIFTFFFVMAPNDHSNTKNIYIILYLSIYTYTFINPRNIKQ